MALYTAGTLVTVTGTFTSSGETPTDPSTVTLKYSPAGTTSVTTVAQASLTHVSTGVWAYNIDTTGFGSVQVIYEFIGTGACQTSGAGMFETEVLPF